MDPIDNNQFEIKPNTKSKRKIHTPSPNVYLNPGLDLLANDDPICNTAMEILPNKKRKRTRSCDIATFENSALDLGISKAAVNDFLMKELENVRKNIRPFESVSECDVSETSEPKIVATKNNILIEVPVSSSKDVFIPLEEFSFNSNSVLNSSEATYANLTDIQVQRAFCSTKPPNSDCVEQFMPIEKHNSNNFTNGDKCTQLTQTIQLKDSYLHNSITNLISNNHDENNSKNTILGQTPEHAFDRLQNNELTVKNNCMRVQNVDTNQLLINKTNDFSLSFIDRLVLDSPNNISSQSLYLDDDLNESNIMEIKTITIITNKKKRSHKNTNPFLEQNVPNNLCSKIDNPFQNMDVTKAELEYSEEVQIDKPIHSRISEATDLVPRRLFESDTNSTMSTVNDSTINFEKHEYESVDGYRSESPIYENVGDIIYDRTYNKQSKILGQDVSRFNALDIMNINKNNPANSSNESYDNKRYLKNHILKASNKLSRKVLKTIKKTFKSDRQDQNATLNPYEVPRKPLKQKTVFKESGIENPALNLDNSDDIEIEELDDNDGHQYETIKTIRNTQLNMNVTPLRERVHDNHVDVSHDKTYTPGKKVRFDSTLNQEKIITGNSFELNVQSPGFDAKIDKYHDELENCINERKFLQQNMS